MYLQTQGWASRVQKECSFNPVGLENLPNSWDIGEACQGQVVTNPNHYKRNGTYELLTSRCELLCNEALPWPLRPKGDGRTPGVERPYI